MLRFVPWQNISYPIPFLQKISDAHDILKNLGNFLIFLCENLFPRRTILEVTLAEILCGTVVSLLHSSICRNGMRRIKIKEV